MSISRKDDLKLKVGNLGLALLLSIVPTSMTLGLLSAHGYVLCKSVDSSLIANGRLSIKDSCLNKNIAVTSKYILFIWLFITLPTWRWFYIGHYRRVTKKNN